MNPTNPEIYRNGIRGGICKGKGDLVRHCVRALRAMPGYELSELDVVFLILEFMPWYLVAHGKPMVSWKSQDKFFNDVTAKTTKTDRRLFVANILEKYGGDIKPGNTLQGFCHKVQKLSVHAAISALVHKLERETIEITPERRQAVAYLLKFLTRPLTGNQRTIILSGAYHLLYEDIPLEKNTIAAQVAEPVELPWWCYVTTDVTHAALKRFEGKNTMGDTNSTLLACEMYELCVDRSSLQTVKAFGSPDHSFNRFLDCVKRHTGISRGAYANVIRPYIREKIESLVLGRKPKRAERRKRG
jgi:hypothetical protein